MLEKAKIGPELVESLGKGMQNLATNVKSMSGLSGAALETEEYAKNVKSASASLSNMNKSYAEAMGAMSEMATACVVQPRILRGQGDTLLRVKQPLLGLVQECACVRRLRVNIGPLSGGRSRVRVDPVIEDGERCMGITDAQ